MNIIFPNSYVVWDLETTGLDPIKNRIVEIAMLGIKDGLEVENYKALINYGPWIAEEATKVHGITAEMCEKFGKPPKQVLEEIIAVFGKYNAHVTHNGIKFDIPFLIESLKRELLHNNEIINYLENRAIDTAAIVKGKKIGMQKDNNETFRQYAERVMSVRAFGVKYNLGLICDELKIDRENVVQHRADGDIYLTNELYKKICLN